MAREAKLFNVSKGYPSKGFLRLTGNMPPSWIDRATASRQALQPNVLKMLRKLKRLRVKRPNAKMTIKAAERDLKVALKQWELAYQKECFYYGIRVLLELERNGETDW
jgi:hypothetical protein